ncbi:MAG: pyruvate kinase [Candidatus Zixiibacteriota bacterium]
MKKTKILVTYGPAVSSTAKIKNLVEAGANAIRINCSHGSTQDFLSAARLIRQSTKNYPYTVGLVFDISGPKLRLDHFKGEYRVKKGQTVVILDRKTDLKSGKIGVNRPEILKSVKKGHRLYIDDGNLVFTVVSTSNHGVVIKSVNGGVIMPSKGVNLPDSDIKIPTISDKDREDIKTAIRVDADYIALSFVRNAADIVEAKNLIKNFGGRQRVIAKLERKEAIDQIEEIISQADGVMLARGDLGVELEPQELPPIQKKIIKLANQSRKPVIIATQMLESMRFAPRATRAEINDVASAVFDFADVVMLSAETATGQYPVEAVKTMDAVIRATESALPEFDPVRLGKIDKSDIPEAIARAVREAYPACQTPVIFAFTSSGFTAELISNLFPPQPVIALTPDKKVMGLMSLYRSVYPVLVNPSKTFQEMLDEVEKIIKEYKLARKGQRVTITGGVPLGTRQPTNFMMIHEVSTQHVRKKN